MEPTNTQTTFWVYLHQYNDPLNPGVLHMLNHYSALVPNNELLLDDRAVAYTSGTNMIPKNSGVSELVPDVNVVVPERHKKKRKRLNMEQKQQMLKETDKGWTQRDIAEEFGIC